MTNLRSAGGAFLESSLEYFHYPFTMAHESHLTRPLDPSSSAASTSSLMDIDGVVGGATLIDVERGRDQVPDDQGASIFCWNQAEIECVLISTHLASFHMTRGGKYTKRIKYYVPGTAWIPSYSLSL
jgi:hypothetical protein